MIFPAHQTHRAIQDRHFTLDRTGFGLELQHPFIAQSHEEPIVHDGERHDPIEFFMVEQHRRVVGIEIHSQEPIAGAGQKQRRRHKSRIDGFHR